MSSLKHVFSALPEDCTAKGGADRRLMAGYMTIPCHMSNIYGLDSMMHAWWCVPQEEAHPPCPESLMTPTLLQELFLPSASIEENS